MTSIDWSSLSPDLLHIICSKLIDIGDFVHVRAVCKAWHSSASLPDPSSRLPWILVNRESRETGHLQFYSLFSGSTYTVHVQQASDAWIFRATRSSLLLCKGREASLSLLNPFVAKETSLPPLKGKIRYPFPRTIVRNPVINKDQIMIMSHPSGESGRRTLSLVTSRPTDGDWTVTELNGTYKRFGEWTYYNGMCFAIQTLDGCMMVSDPVTGNLVSKIPDFKRRDNGVFQDYLVESGGKLLRIGIENSKNIEQLSLDVYVLDVQEERYRWLEIEDIDNHILFLDKGGGFCLTSSEFHGIRGNCIYFFSHQVEMNSEILNVSLITDNNYPRTRSNRPFLDPGTVCGPMMSEIELTITSGGFRKNI
ncbi:hypothetical protein LUZ61_013794 [Rhynchospora tenuis]|uniref:KIB1-4 beta-propeller domain-containing protein n=1 Tax=Rhynchospora tenuis TaxID=198213 RepID=A0AAD5WA23_9POAL|nr:hypothetical protein LUZ61_013794 [Rhynchospora tenuis]